MSSVPILAALLLGALPSFEQGLAKYDALEYEAAVIALKKAETEAASLQDRARVQLFLGLSYAELAQWRNAESAFRNALVLEPTAQLPSKSSPKIEKLFGDLRSQFASASAAAKPATPPEAPRAAATAAPLAPDGPVLEAARPTDSAPLPLRPALLMGGGVLAAGGGLALGLASRSSADSARSEPIQTAAADHADSSRGQAIAANVFFAAASSLAIAAVVDYLMPSEKEGAR